MLHERSERRVAFDLVLGLAACLVYLATRMKKDRRLRPVILMVLPRLIPPLLPSGNLCAGTRCELRDGREPSPGPRSTAKAKGTRGLGGENRIVCDECTPYTIPAPHAHTHTHTHTPKPASAIGWFATALLYLPFCGHRSPLSLSLSFGDTLGLLLEQYPLQTTSHFLLFHNKNIFFFFKESFFCVCEREAVDDLGATSSSLVLHT